jgi:choline dehydrogenase-like flavoprotein
MLSASTHPRSRGRLWLVDRPGGTAHLTRDRQPKPPSKYLRGPTLPTESDPSGGQLAEHAKRGAQTDYHALGTLAMGIDETTVVVPQLKVRSVDGRRGVDASAMPTVVSGNTNAATVMIAEKARTSSRGRRPWRH